MGLSLFVIIIAIIIVVSENITMNSLTFITFMLTDVELIFLNLEQVCAQLQ